MPKGHHWKDVEGTQCKTGKGQGWAVSMVVGSGGWEGKRCNMLFLICGLCAGHKEECWFDAEGSTAGLGSER